MAFDLIKPRFLLCEGDDDKGFLQSLIATHGLPDFQVCHAAECNDKAQGGRSGFRHSLRGIEVLSGFSLLRAILLVSDNDSADSFGEVQQEIKESGNTPPATIAELGSVSGKPLVVLMLPTDELGDFEKLCLPEIHRVWERANECVTAFLACTGADKWTKTASVNKARARAAAVGFNESDPYKGIGHLFRSGTLSTTNRCFQPVVDFLRGFDAMAGI